MNKMNRMVSWAVLTAIAATATARADFFTFGATLRAGLSGNGDWEVGGGDTSGVPYATTAQVNPYWSDLLIPQTFRIAYTEASNTVSVSVRTALNVLIGQISYNPTNGGSVPTGRTYTINPAGMYVSASPQNPTIPSGIVVSNLALSPGLTVLQPFTTTSLSAFRIGNTTATDNLPQAVSFQTAPGAGDWYLDGTIQFLGLGAYIPGGVTRSRSQFHFNVTGENTTAAVPEPGTWMMMGCGLVLLGMGSYRRRVRG